MQPLAERMRPQNLDDYIGQKHLVGKEGVLSKSINSGLVPSFIMWGPPGVGKTTLASIISKQLKRSFITLSAINSGVKDIREAIKKAESKQFFNTANPILFIDEIHRFSKSQQDSLLGAVEKGTITLIGATTENPSFEVISALLSRCQVYVLEHLQKEEMVAIIDQAIEKDTELQKLDIEIESYDSLIKFSSGDARKLLNCLEISVNHLKTDNQKITITNEAVDQIIQNNLVLFDKGGEQHYDIISAFIKSIRGSDPNAAVYYLARMVEGGEDPLFICRRMIILASEDIGLANSNALLLATNCAAAVHQVGMPESRIIMSHCAIYLANSEKSNSAYKAINNAQQLVRDTGNLPIPLSLRNAPTKLMKSLDYGKDYQYAHDHDGNFAEIEFMPEKISGQQLYKPSDNKYEASKKEKLRLLWKEKYGY